MRVPATVARGIVLSGASTDSAGIVPASSPRNDQSVRAATADSAEKLESPLGLNGTKCSAFSQKIPAKATAASGISFKKVVVTCIHPAARIPRQLTQVRIQMAP